MKALLSTYYILAAMVIKVHGEGICDDFCKGNPFSSKDFHCQTLKNFCMDLENVPEEFDFDTTEAVSTDAGRFREVVCGFSLGYWYNLQVRRDFRSAYWHLNRRKLLSRALS